jgi:thioredoxin 1
MEGIKKQLTAVLNYENFWSILIASTVIIIACVYVYIQYVDPKIKSSYVPNKEFASEGNQESSTETADLYFFYTLWCPHCKKSKPIWEELKAQVGNNTINGVRINFIEVDCDKDSATAEKFKVEGYPTIKMVRGNQIIEYDAKPNLETLNQFLQTSL